MKQEIFLNLIESAGKHLESAGRKIQTYLDQKLPSDAALREAAEAIDKVRWIVDAEIVPLQPQMQHWHLCSAAHEAEHIKKVQTLISVTGLILAEKTVPGMLNRIVDAARLLTGSNIGVAGYRYEEGVFSDVALSTSQSTPAGAAGDRVAMGTCIRTCGFLIDLLQDKRPVRLTDEELRNSRMWVYIPERHVPLKGLLGVPLIGEDGRADGLILITGKREGDFSDEDETFLVQLAALASLGLQHIDARREAEQHMTELQATIASIADAVLIICPEGRIRNMNRAAEHIFGYTRAELDLPMEDRIRMMRIEHPDGSPFKVEDMPGYRALRGETVRDVQMSIVCRTDGMRRWLSASAGPILSEEGALLGAISTFSDITRLQELQEGLRRAHDELEKRIRNRTAALSRINRALKAEIIARKKVQTQLKDYHNQLRNLATELSLTEEKERRRLAIELHDHIGQALAISRIRINEIMEKAPSEEVVSLLKNVRQLIDQSIHDTRSIITELSPPALYELDFFAAVEWLAESIQEQHGIAVDLDGNGRVEQKIDRNLKILLFQAIRELLMNVVKHARANRVWISIQCSEYDIRITVEDDGVGYDASTRRKPDLKSGGFGIFSIRERLMPLGGDLHIDSGPGRGTRAMIVLDVKEGKRRREREEE
ncbi:MAG: ATP-binding protein [Syntrophales bacterium]